MTFSKLYNLCQLSKTFCGICPWLFPVTYSICLGKSKAWFTQRRKHKHKKPTCKPVRRKHKRLVLALVLMLASSRFTRTKQRRKHKHKQKRMERFFHSLVLVLTLASLRRTCKPGRRKHKHTRKERKLKNSDKLSAYNLVTHALPFSAMLESNLGCFCACVCHVMLMLSHV